MHHDLDVTWILFLYKSWSIETSSKSVWADLALSPLIWCFMDRDSVRWILNVHEVPHRRDGLKRPGRYEYQCYQGSSRARSLFLNLDMEL